MMLSHYSRSVRFEVFQPVTLRTKDEAREVLRPPADFWSTASPKSATFAVKSSPLRNQRKSGLLKIRGDVAHSRKWMNKAFFLDFHGKNKAFL